MRYEINGIDDEAFEAIKKVVESHDKKTYDEGFADGYKNAQISNESYEDTYKCGYEKGLNDAWAAVKKLMEIPLLDRDRVFDSQMFGEIIRDRTPSTVISMLEKYEKDKKIAEEERKDIDRQFAIGNIVWDLETRSNCLMVVRQFMDDKDRKRFCGIDKDGIYYPNISCDRYFWDGRHSGYKQFLTRGGEQDE